LKNLNIQNFIQHQSRANANGTSVVMKKNELKLDLFSKTTTSAQNYYKSNEIEIIFII
jgi:hypothetical protein